MSSSNNFTPRENDLIKAVGKQILTANIDWQKVADEEGYPTAKRARDKWYPIRDKLFGLKKGDVKTPTSGQKATPRKRKGFEDQLDATPSKKGKQTHASPTTYEDDDESKLVDERKVKEEVEEFLQTYILDSPSPSPLR